MINVELLVLGATVLLLLQLVAAVEARTRALPTVPRSGVPASWRRPAESARSFGRRGAAEVPDRSERELAHA